MQQKTLMGCAVAAACIAMASGAFAAEYTGKNETVTPGATQLFGHVSSTQDVVTSTDDVFNINFPRRMTLRQDATKKSSIFTRFHLQSPRFFVKIESNSYSQ